MENLQNTLNEVDALLRRHHVLSKEVLTLNESAEYLSISKSALYKMTSKREISFYNPGGKKLYFRRSELDSWVFNSKVIPVSEVDQEIEGYLGRTQKSRL